MAVIMKANLIIMSFMEKVFTVGKIKNIIKVNGSIT